MNQNNNNQQRERRAGGRTVGTQLFENSIDQAIKDLLRLGSELPVSCPKPLLDLIEVLTERRTLRSTDVLDAVERLEARGELVVISTAVGWSIRLATPSESENNDGRPTSESPWALIHRQLDAMRAIADDRYSLEYAEQRKPSEH